MGERCLAAEDITVTREGRRIVDAASIAVDSGAIVTVRGSSGSGKSTLLRAIATLIPVDRGRVTLDAKTPRELGIAEYRRRVAYVPQMPAMFDGLVSDNLRAGPRYRDVEIDDAKVKGLLAQVGLPASLAERAAGDLSGGERLRVALARALANEPRVLLLDEPTAALDPEAAHVVLDSVIALARGGTAVLAVTHVEAHAARLGGERWRMTSGALEKEEAT